MSIEDLVISSRGRMSPDPAVSRAYLRHADLRLNLQWFVGLVRERCSNHMLERGYPDGPREAHTGISTSRPQEKETTTLTTEGKPGVPYHQHLRQ